MLVRLAITALESAIRDRQNTRVIAPVPYHFVIAVWRVKVKEGQFAAREDSEIIDDIMTGAFDIRQSETIL